MADEIKHKPFTACQHARCELAELESRISTLENWLDSPDTFDLPPQVQARANKQLRKMVEYRAALEMRIYLDLGGQENA